MSEKHTKIIPKVTIQAVITKKMLLDIKARSKKENLTVSKFVRRCLILELYKNK